MAAAEGEEEAATVGSISEFLTEHHRYLVEKTTAQVASLERSMRAEWREREAELASAHRREVDRLEEEKAELARQLRLAQHSLTALVGEKETANWTTATRFLMGKQAVTKRNVFVAWWKVAITEKADRLLARLATKRHAHYLKARVLAAWYRSVHGSRAERFVERANQRLKVVTSEIITRYEGELDKLKAHIRALDAQLADGRRRRAALEDELRRTLLKGMVTMNLETLSIFSSAAATDTALALEDACPLPRSDPPNPETIRLLSHQNPPQPPASSSDHHHP